MKLTQLIEAVMQQTKTVARFGTARLIQAPSGRFQLVGGTTEERLAAREWASMFLHEAVLGDRKKLNVAS